MVFLLENGHVLKQGVETAENKSFREQWQSHFFQWCFTFPQHFPKRMHAEASREPREKGTAQGSHPGPPGTAGKMEARGADCQKGAKVGLERRPWTPHQASSTELNSRRTVGRRKMSNLRQGS